MVIAPTTRATAARSSNREGDLHSLDNCPVQPYATNSATATGGRKGIVLNFAASAIPTVKPTHAALAVDGAMSIAFQRQRATRKASTNGMSVVARPECATTLGKVATRHVAKAATRGFDHPPLNTHVITSVSQKTRT